MKLRNTDLLDFAPFMPISFEGRLAIHPTLARNSRQDPALAPKDRGKRPTTISVFSKRYAEHLVVRTYGVEDSVDVPAALL